MNNFMVGVASSLAAAFLFAILAWSRGWIAFTWQRIYRTRNLIHRLQQAGLTNFFSSRVDFAKYRGAPSLLDYLSTAKKSIKVAAYWMSQGIEMEGLAQKLANMTKPPANISLMIAIIDPTAAYVPGLAQYLGMNANELILRAQSSLHKLWEARQSLSEEEKKRFELKVYLTIPIASVILLDVEEDWGKLQIDFKPYKTPRNSSFSFELTGRGHPLYETCRDSWITLLEDAEPFTPERHLIGYPVI